MKSYTPWADGSHGLHLAQMYHHDKVAGLAPEFQARDDKKMKEINAAYEALKRRG